MHLRLHPMTIVGAVLALFAALTFVLVKPASAQIPQPADDTISIDVSDDGCTVRIDWRDGREISSKLRVAVDDLFQSDRTLDDNFGDDSRSFTLAKLDPGSHEVHAILRGFTSSQDETEGNLDEERVTVDCKAAPTPTPVPPTATPQPTATAVPATATPVPPAPTPIVIVQSEAFGFCSNGTIVDLRKGERCPVTPPPVATPVTVTQPAQLPAGVIRPPSTGSGGLLP